LRAVQTKGGSVTQQSFIGHRLAVTFAASAFAFVATMAEAETTVRIARQFGIAYLPLTIMEQKQVLEEHGRRRGLDLKTEWMKLGSGARMNEASRWRRKKHSGRASTASSII
jgi:ABC-type nitrate/sulfonate/bicarbonate transport system substrate-binding protein